MIVLCASLVVVCFWDYTKGKIPNLFPVILCLWGLVQGCLQDGFGAFWGCLFKMAGVLVVLYPLFRIGGLGAGDVKLLCVCAGYFQVSRILIFLFLSLLISAVFSVVPLVKERNLKERALYFCEYCTAVVRSGKWQLYLPGKDHVRFRGVCMSGPILCSVLLGMGGLY